MSKNWREIYYDKEMCSGSLKNLNNGDISVSGTLKVGNPNSKIMFWAPSPANHITSYYGSGLPFPNPKMAYDGPNNGAVQAVDGKFTFLLKYLMCRIRRLLPC